MTNRCPTDLALERYLLDPAASPLSGHVDGCEPCRGRIARMKEEGERFRRFVYPATVDRIEAAARRRPARWWMSVLVPVPALAALAAVVVVLRPVGPADDYVGLKGAGGVGLTAFVQRGGAATPVPDGGAVPAAAELRLRIRTSAACRLFVISVDAGGAVSRLDAADAGGLPLQAGQHDLPGGVALDGAAGPERLFAVCAPAGVAWPQVEQAGRAAGGGADRVRGTTSLGGLPAGTAQATLLLEKRP
ncbi:MAG TPA: DUF4384 domain-containing protein [Anaeromyxobacter sp.]|nr:DUF4384 domain-containing protein [Anaeromyxobacter sp.]